MSPLLSSLKFPFIVSPPSCVAFFILETYLGMFHSVFRTRINFYMDTDQDTSILGWIPIGIRIQGLMTKKEKKKFTTGIQIKFFWINICTIYLFLGLHKGGPAFSHQKRTSSTSKHEISKNFFQFCGHFCPPGPRSWYGSTELIESGSNPDPKHWFHFLCPPQCFVNYLVLRSRPRV
jgi:hypothetical protein